MRSRNCTAVRLINRSANIVNWKDTLARQMAKLKKKKREREGRQALMVPARINGNRRKIMPARLSRAAPGCDYISIVHTFIFIIHGDVYQT